MSGEGNAENILLTIRLSVPPALNIEVPDVATILDNLQVCPWREVFSR